MAVNAKPACRIPEPLTATRAALHFQVFTPLDTPDYEDQLDGMATAAWHSFMLHDPVAKKHWGDLFARFPEYQLALRHQQTGKCLNSTPPGCGENPGLNPPTLFL